jgi:hypothetical protein
MQYNGVLYTSAGLSAGTFEIASFLSIFHTQIGLKCSMFLERLHTPSFVIQGFVKLGTNSGPNALWTEPSSQRAYSNRPILHAVTQKHVNYISCISDGSSFEP